MSCSSVLARSASVIAVLASVFAAAGVAGQDRLGIDEREFALQVRWLDLNDQQHAVARSLFEEYRTWLLKDLAPRVRKIGVLSAWERGYEQWRRDHGDEHDALMSELEEKDRRYFENLEALLTDEQLPRMDRVLLGRQRFRWRVGREQLPGANVDLIELVEGLPLGQLKRRHESQVRRARMLRKFDEAERPFDVQALPLEERGLALGDEEHERVEAIISDFEPQFVRALREASEETSRRIALSYKGVYINQRIEADGEDLEARERARLERRRDAYWDRATRTGNAARRRLRALNEAALVRFEAALSEANAELLRSRYLELAYPQVYPDRASAVQLYDVAQDLDDLNEGQRPMLDALRAQFLREHEALSEEMAEAVMAKYTEAGNREQSIENSYEGGRRLLELGRKREALNEKQFNLLRAQLTPEQREHLPDWDFEANPPPRPWDPNAEATREQMR